MLIGVFHASLDSKNSLEGDTASLRSNGSKGQLACLYHLHDAYYISWDKAYNEISSKSCTTNQSDCEISQLKEKKCIYYFGLSQRLVSYTSHNSGKHNTVV